MVIAHVFIKDQIGTSEENGQTVKGVEVIDVVEQFMKQPNADAYHVHINSPGGSVEIGNQIADYLSKQKNVFTIAEEWCASIATRIHLSVPLQNRFIQEGTAYMIHNPLFSNIGGNAAELMDAAKYLLDKQKDLVSVYVKATGMDKSAIQSLMNVETQFSADQCVKMGFASKITPKMQYKAVAFSNNPTKNDNMAINAKLIAAIDALSEFAGLKKADDKNTDPAASGRKPKDATAMKIMTDKGEIDTPFDDLMVGDAVTMADGTPALDATYTADNGMVIVVKDGMIEAITEAEETDDVEALKAEIETLKASNTSLQAKITEQEGELAQIETVVQAVQAKISGSTFEPAASATAFRRPVTGKSEPEKITREALADRRAQYKSKK